MVAVAHCLGASIEDGCAVEILVILDGVAVLDNALGAAVVWRRAVFTIYQRWRMWDERSSTHSSDVSAFGWIWMRMEREAWSPGRVS